MGRGAEPVRDNAVMESLCGDGYSEKETLRMTPTETPQERPEGPSARFFEAQRKEDFKKRQPFPVGGEAGRQKGVGAVTPQEGQDSPVERLGRKNPVQEVLVLDYAARIGVNKANHLI